MITTRQRSPLEMIRMILCIIIIIVVVTCIQLSLAQISKPISKDTQLTKNEFNTRTAVDVDQVLFGTDATGFHHTVASEKCAAKKSMVDIDIIWQSEVGSSIYQTPTITYLDAKSPFKDIVISTFVRYVEALHGPTGSEKHQGSVSIEQEENESHRHGRQSEEPSIWPFSHSNFMSHGSALMYDIDGDHEQEVVVSTGDGELVFLKSNGRLMRDRSFKLLPLRLEKNWFQGLNDETMDISMNLMNRKQQGTRQQQQQQQANQPNVANNPEAQDQNRKTEKDTELPSEARLNEMKTKMKNKKQTRKLLQVAEDQGSSTKQETKKEETSTDALLSAEAKESMKLIHIPKSMRALIDELDRHDNPFIPADYEQKLKEQKKRDEKEFGSLKNFVYVDPHLLNTPVIVDLDNDGSDDIIFAVTYFFDEEYYASDPFHRSKLDSDIDIHKYVAGGLVVYDLATMKLKWELHLDLTTDRTNTRAHIYATPIVADIDSDGLLEVVIATSMGWIYVVDRKGKTKEGFPILIGEMQGQPIVEDVNNDGDVEICAGDANSNVVCFNYKGKVVWEKVTSGRLSSGLTAADLDGDGILDIVATSTSGHIWAIKGDTGDVLPGFPVKTDGPILSSASILTGLSDDPQSATIIAPSHDGYVYFVDAKTTCIDKFDIGERIYSQVLIDDVTGNGYLNLIVTTMNGNVLNLGTTVPYDPLKTITGMTPNVAYRANYHGLSVTKNSRKHRDEFGSSFKVEFDIVDNRKMPSHIPRRYTIRITIGGTYELLKEKIYDKPGRYVVIVPTPSKRFYGKVIVSMVNEHGVRFEDEFTLGFNIAFLNLFKWMIVLPFMLCAGLLLYLFGTDATYLDSKKQQHASAVSGGPQ